MLRAAAEYSLHREPGERYCEVARDALTAAKNTGEPVLVARALFELARAGTESGLMELVLTAERGVKELAESVDIRSIPMSILTKAFCSMFLLRPRDALPALLEVSELPECRANLAQLAFIHSAIGLSHTFLCNLQEAQAAFLVCVELARRVGDDSRASNATANLCAVHVYRGQYEEAVRYGELSLKLGKASSSNTLLTSYVNLVDAYVLIGREAAAIECIESARRWLLPERRWKLRCAFLSEAATFALIQGNTSHALDLIAELQALAQDREDAVPMVGSYWKLKVFREAHIGSTDKAGKIAAAMLQRLQDACPLHYLDVLGAEAWLESWTLGRLTAATERDLGIFERVGASGRKALLTAQGFLAPKPTGESKGARAKVAGAC
jgi:tetratricopeptide (TPR) repeat protein